MPDGVTRRQDNVLNTPFSLRFVERVYDGAPRWWSKEWEKHHNTPSGRDGYRLDREEDVKKSLRAVSDPKKFFNERIPFLITCVNYKCPLRAWLTVNFLAIKKSFVIDEKHYALDGSISDTKEREGLRQAINDGLAQMARGKDPKDQCPQCREKQYYFGVSGISGKWIYVLKAVEGSPLKPHCEILMETPLKGAIHLKFKDGQFTDDYTPFDGVFVLDKITEHVWHFFLSPVKLGKNALKLLFDAPKSDFNRRITWSDPHSLNVGYIPQLQPWATTVMRRFNARQLQTPNEFIPLVDPFSWVAQIVEFDYFPIAAAQQELIQNEKEQAKAFVAGTLATAIGRKQVSDNPPKFASEDQWNVKDETIEPPSEFQSSGNIAKAWVDRYQSAIQFVTEETNYACCRVFYPVGYSLAHRIVELACQENTTDAEFLALGLTHWNHILRDMLLCKTGEGFTAWVAKNMEAADRIPQKNVVRGEGLKPGTKLANDIPVGLPIHILMFLSPVIIGRSNNPTADLVKHFENFGVPAEALKVDSPGLKVLDVLNLKTVNIILDITGNFFDAYLKKLPLSILPAGAQTVALKDLTPSVGLSWKERTQSFTALKDIEKILTLLTAIYEFTKKTTPYQTEWDRFEHVKKEIEAPVMMAQFLAETRQRFIKAGLRGDIAQIQSKPRGWSGFRGLESDEIERLIADKLEKKGIKALTATESELLKMSRSLQGLKSLGIGLRVIAGPVGLILGGADLVMQIGQIGEALESGDPGKATGLQIQAAGTVLIISVAAAETVALVYSAGAVAWAGPVGWIAAGLILIGTVVMAYGSKNDLQLFASHCFFGKDEAPPGGSKTGKAWMDTDNWFALRDTEKARLALFRLLTGFSTWISPSVAGNEFRIYPSYVPSGTSFEIEVDLTPKGHDTPKEKYKARAWPLAKDYIWIDQGDGEPKSPTASGSSGVFVHGDANQIEYISVTAFPKAITGPFNQTFRVRLLYDADGHNALPPRGWVENSDINMHGIYNTVSSSDA